jgi:hypothetical protein
MGLVLFTALGAHAQNTSFTYQGRLQDGGAPANGSYDLQFSLFDASTGGSKTSQTLIGQAIAVTNGIFSVPLDFGSSAFPGASRWLEIGVRPGASTGSFTTLSPRQPITSTPYAIQSLNATNALQLGGVTADQFVFASDSRLSDARPPTTGSTNYIQNTTNPQSSSNFNISGNGTVAGTLSTTNLGVGTTSPGAQLEAKGPGEPVTLINHTGNAGNPALWFAQDGTPRSYIWWDQATGQFNLGNGLTNPQISLFNNGTVAIGTTYQGAAQLNVQAVNPFNYGVTATASLQGVSGYGGSIGVYGGCTGNCIAGVFGNSVAGNGVDGESQNGYGVSGSSSNGYGVFGSSSNNYAGYFLGNVYVTGALTQNSDERLKQQISELRYGLREVLQLRPVTWTWKEEPGRGLQLGLIAQEVEALVPELVSTAKDAEQTKGLNYIGLVPVTIKAIQEQQTQIDRQQRQIHQQQSQIDGLKALVCPDHPSAIVCR